MAENHPVGIDSESLRILEKALTSLGSGFQHMDPFTAGKYDMEKIEKVMLRAAERMKDNFPYFHPMYAGQMMKPPHPVARLAYMLALYINPNNHALDGGRASSQMEKEAVASIAAMFGWDRHLGHLTGGGTLANLEALWVAGKERPDGLIVASTQAHYTHERLTKVLGLPFRTVQANNRGKMDIDALRRLLDTEKVGTVVATVGTTATGATDPLPEILALQEKFGFRIHADTAYGGYFTLAANLAPDTRAVYDRLGEVDSIVVDPHKHGLQPYGCGCIVFRDPSVGQYYKHDSPYTYFSSDELHLGEISLECSRPGASAVALWTTQQLIPSVRGGEHAAMLEKSRQAALGLYDRLSVDPRFITAFPPELDILIWAPAAATVSEASRRSRQLFAETQKLNLHLALADLPLHFFDTARTGMEQDQDHLVCLRSVLMKPEHADWIDRICDVLGQAAKNIGL